MWSLVKILSLLLINIMGLFSIMCVCWLAYVYIQNENRLGFVIFHVSENKVKISFCL